MLRPPAFHYALSGVLQRAGGGAPYIWSLSTNHCPLFYTIPSTRSTYTKANMVRAARPVPTTMVWEVS